MPSIKYKKKTYAGATFPVLEMTKAEYDALSEAKKMDGTVYMITDDIGGWEAENSAYDNTSSGLTATNVQSALDELNSKSVLNAVSWLRSTEYQSGDATCMVTTLGDSLVHLTVMTKGRVHLDDEYIMDIPSGYRPYNMFYAVASHAGRAIVLRFNTNGTVQIWTGCDGTSSGRVYLDATYFRA